MNTSGSFRLRPVQRVLRTWDRISIYLPLVLMGALALGTYWLVRNSPVLSPQQTAKAPKHEIDYFMRQFTIKSFGDAGQFKSEVWLTRNARRVNVKSIMGVMMLAAAKGAQVEIETNGNDEEAAMQALTQLITDKFGEGE